MTSMIVLGSLQKGTLGQNWAFWIANECQQIYEKGSLLCFKTLYNKLKEREFNNH